MEKNESFNQIDLTHETIELAPDTILFPNQPENLNTTHQTIDSNDHKINPRTKKYISRIALGLIAAGGVYALAEQPSSTLHEIEKAAPIVGAGAIGSEVLWDVGAIMMAVGVGSKIGNPLTIRSRWDEIGNTAVNNPLTKVGLTINTLGALSLSGFMVYGGTKLSPALWPGVAGVVTLDVLATAAVRAPIIAAMRNKDSDSEVNANKSEVIKKIKPKIRTAKLDDLERLTEIDIKLFRKAYGAELPDQKDVYEMLKKRYLNNPDWMFVAEVDGVIEGFVSAFPTNVSKEEFVSWEESTANGTLDGKVNPEGKYAYLTNMTINSEAVKLGAEEMLLGNLLAKCISEGTEYGYFISRIPSFKRYVARNQINVENAEDLRLVAEEYANSRRKNGKRRDPELNMYENLGCNLERTVQDAFSDDASLNFGVVCSVMNPIKNKITDIKPIRLTAGLILRKISNHKKILNKVL